MGQATSTPHFLERRGVSKRTAVPMLPPAVDAQSRHKESVDCSGLPAMFAARAVDELVGLALSSVNARLGLRVVLVLPPDAEPSVSPASFRVDLWWSGRR